MSSSHWQRVFVGKTESKIVNVFLLLSVLLLNTGGVVQAHGIGWSGSSDKKNGGIAQKLLKHSDLSSSSNQNPYYQTGCVTSGDLVIANGITCNLPSGTYTYNSVTVQTGGTLIISGNTTLNQGVTINVPNMTVESGGKVNADGKGYPGNTSINGGGPGGGKGPNPIWTGGGGGYGGIGESGDGAGGVGYGSVTSPNQLGSSGGAGRCTLTSSCPGGAGGGAIKLLVSGTLSVNGEISANGISGGARSGGGSGGSIWIDANTLDGAGTIHANGGAGLEGGDGAGGRLAVYHNNGTFPLDPQHVYARGMYQAGNGGGPGTVYLKDTGNQTDKLVVNNAGNSVTTYAVHLPGTYSYDQIELSGRGTLNIAGSTSRFTLTGNNVLAGDGTGQLQAAGTIITPASLVIDNVSVTILGNIEGAQDITLIGPGVLELYATSLLHSGTYTFNSISVGSGATLKLVNSGNGDANYTNDPGLQLHVANLTVDAGGKVTANGTGYPGKHESGTGPGAGQSVFATGGGGGHGGVGQNGAGAGGVTYDSVGHPARAGSSGGAGQDIFHSVLPGGAGGGAIWLVVSDTLTVNGDITADGVIGANRSGGGSGGSIVLEATNLVGNGKVHANGGPQNGGGNGAGGRIAVYTSNASHTITFTANGAPGYETPGKGTIFLDVLDLTNSTITISPSPVVADGSTASTVTVTLINVDGFPMPNKPVEIAVATGQGISINGQAIGPNKYISIGNTDANGVVTAALTTQQPGARNIRARSQLESIMTTAEVEFTPNPAGPVIQNKAVVSSGSAGDQCTDCIGCSVNNTQGGAGGPINTRTGGYDYTVADLSFVTTAGELSFVHTYSSLAVDLSTNLAPGWTHNQDMHLTFSDDPGGEEGVVLLKSRSANQYSFFEDANGTYEAAPGIRATLVRNSGTPVHYTVVDSAKNVYTFDEDGKLTTFANPQGHSWSYTYTSNGSLDQVSANDGASYLGFDYDSQGRITSVSDHSGRDVSFGYDLAGDLVTVIDVLDQTWTYTYDNAHRITRVTAPDQTIIERTEYDSQGRAVRQYDGEDNLVVELTYNADGTTTVTDALGNDQTHTYDARGTLVGETNAVNAEMTTLYGNNFQPTQVTNAAGHTLSMTWSADGVNLLNKTDPAGNFTQNTYDSLNNLTSTTDAQGNTTTYTYSGKLLLTSTDALDGTTTYTYTPEGYLASVTDPAGRTTSYTYNANGQRASMTDPSGNAWHYTYDPLGRLTDTTDPRGRVSHSEYNAAGQIVRSVQNYSPTHAQNDQDVYNIVTEYEYNARGAQVSVTDTFDHTTQYVYDDAGRQIQTVDAAGNTTTNEYDAAGRLISTADALGHETTYTYDATGRLLSTTNALGISSGTTAFDIPTNTSTVTNIAGAATTFHYDELGHVVKVVDALGNFTLTAYDANGNVDTRTDALGRVTQYEYDDLNRLIRTIDPNGGVTESVYNDKGQRIASIDALENQTTYTYDEFGRLTDTTDPLGRVTSTEYDQYGRRAAGIDAAGNRITYTYDLLDRVIAVTDPLNDSTLTDYNALGSVMTRTDANGHATTYTYDNLDRVKTVTDANGNTTTNTYDAAGNLIASTNALDEATTYSYDALNRRTGISDPLGNTAQTYFNSLGQASSVADVNGVITHFEYDPLGRQTAVILNYHPTVQPDAETNVRYEYTYNAVGNREAVKDPSGNTTNYTYDALNRVIGKSDPLTNTWSYEYDAAGNQITMTDAKNQVTHFTYDDARQLITIDYPAPDADVSFTYTVTGQRDSMQDGLGTTNWAYDDLGRVIEVEDAFNQTVGYEYDAVGNRTGLIYPDGHTAFYTFDPANRLTDVSDVQVGASYDYDAANRLSEITRTNGVSSIYTYNAAGRVAGLTHSAAQDQLASYEYTYDAAGNLIQAVEDVSAPIPPTPTPSNMPTETATSTATLTETSIPSPTGTETLAPIDTPTITSTPPDTLTPTAIDTETPTATQPESTSTFTPVPTDTEIPSLTPTLPPQLVGTDLYLHGTGANANPATLFLNSTAPTAATAKYKDSTSINFNNGNPWKEVGTWAAGASQSSGELTSLNDLHVWLGLKNSDDQGTRFDLRTEVYRNGALVSSGQTLCITDVTRNENQAKEVTVAFDAFAPVGMNGTTDSLSVKILTRVGTNGAGGLCGGHNNAVGLRLYFDSTARPSKFGTVTSVAGALPSFVMEPNYGLSLVSLPLPEPRILSDAPRNALQASGNRIVGTPLVINYTYDPLSRLKIADYSDGRDFAYTYDPNGNTLEAAQDLGAGTVTTMYTYDIANQLVTAQADSTVWRYEYDANGSLIEVLPDGNDASGAKRYTYNVAGYLTQVESHDGSGWNTQAEMAYNGLGTRLTSSALGITTQYASDGQLPLTVNTAGKIITILYGLDPIAEKTDAWNYVLGDAKGTPRQLVDMNSEITLSMRYSPWGKPMDISGVENFDMSYISSLVDFSTGLMYIGNGQYYDPETGRFLTRGANPNSPNPYVPWNPLGAILGPLGLVSALYTHKKIKQVTAIGSLSIFLVACGRLLVALIVAVVIIAFGINACTSQNNPQEVDSPQNTLNAGGAGNDNGTTPSAPPPATEPPGTGTSPCDNCTPTQEPTPTPTPAPTLTLGVPPATYFDKTQLANFPKHQVAGLLISALDLYEHYLYLWDWNQHTGWWWDVYGGDADGFSFWEYVSLYTNHEAAYHHPDFAEDMSEAGVRFWYQRVKEGYASPGQNGFVDWWASFSESEARDVASKNLPDLLATVSEYQAFRSAGEYFRDPPSNWQTGQDLYRPYNWGNLNSIQQHSNNSRVGQMLNANSQRYPIIFRYVGGGNPFYVPSGCAAVNWIDNSDANSGTAWNPDACDYLLSK